MRHLSVVLFVLSLGLCTASAQSSDKSTGYKTFVLNGKTVLLLTNQGTIRVIDLKTNQVDSSIHTDAPVVALGLDKKGTVVAGDTTHLVKRYDAERKTWQSIGTYADKLTNIVFNSQNQCLLITNKGIVDLVSNSVYFPDESFSQNRSIRYKAGWFQPPTCYADRKDRLWLGFDHGEWGGDVLVFDTKTRVFTPLQAKSVEMDMNPVSAFCEASQNVYMSGGLSHMFLTYGSIVKFTNDFASRVLLSEDRETPVKMVITDPNTGKKRTATGTTWKGGLRIGPIAYNPANNCLYFYSQNGFYKGDVTANLSAIKNWQNVLKPALRWTSGRSNAVGPAMNVLKMEFTSDGTLLFLTEHDGLGIYSGKDLRFIK